MNIFRTSDSPYESALVLDDARVVKMTLETAQILSTALRMHGVDYSGLYRATHEKHPCTLWAAETHGNFDWLCGHGLALAMEYHFRFGRRRHKSEEVIGLALRFVYQLPEIFPPGAETPAPFCGPEDILPDAPVTDRYRELLRRKWATDKRPPRWTLATPPEWKEEG